MEGVKPKKYSFKHFLVCLLLISVLVVIVYNFTIRSFNSNYPSAKFTIQPLGIAAELRSSSISDTKPSKMVTPDLPPTNTTEIDMKQGLRMREKSIKYHQNVWSFMFFIFCDDDCQLFRFYQTCGQGLKRIGNAGTAVPGGQTIGRKEGTFSMRNQEYTQSFNQE